MAENGQKNDCVEAKRSPSGAVQGDVSGGGFIREEKRTDETGEYESRAHSFTAVHGVDAPVVGCNHPVSFGFVVDSSTLSSRFLCLVCNRVAYKTT